MEKEKMEGLIIDYIDDRLNAVDRKLIEEEIKHNAVARKMYEELQFLIFAMDRSEPLEPSTALNEKFRRDLQSAISAHSSSRTVLFRPAFYRVAAAIALMVISGAIGFWISRNDVQHDRLTEIEREMEATRQQLAETKTLMLGMISNDESASQRLKGVNVALALPGADEEIVAVLFNTMQSDPNTNVRLAALEALAKFQHSPGVRQRLIQSLSIQSDPMVQIRLIQLMVGMREKAVVNDLQKMVDDAGTMKAVKDEAYSGILKLS